MATENIQTFGKKGRASYSHRIADAKKDRKRREAEDRQEAYDKLTIAEKLKMAIGSKEKAKLEKKFAESKKPAPVAKVEVVSVVAEKKKSKKS